MLLQIISVDQRESAVCSHCAPLTSRRYWQNRSPVDQPMPRIPFPCNALESSGEHRVRFVPCCPWRSNETIAYKKRKIAKTEKCPPCAHDIGKINLPLTNTRSRKPLTLKPLASISVNQRFPFLHFPASDIGKINLLLTNVRTRNPLPRKPLASISGFPFPACRTAILAKSTCR